MDFDEAKRSIIELIEQPKGTRVAYLNAKRIESNYDEVSFFKLLNSAAIYWANELEKSVDPETRTLNIFQYYPDKNIRLGKNELILVTKVLKEYSSSIVSKLKSYQDHTTEKKYPAKYYALYHWILISLGKEPQFEKDEFDHFPKRHIVLYSENRYPGISGQSFYQSFRDIDITKKTAIANSFKGYKEILIDISNNDSNIVSYLSDWPN